MLTVLLLILVEGMFLYSCSRNYYNSVQQTMYRRFSSVNGQLKMYTGDTAQKAAANRSVALRRMVEQFSDKDKYEFMLLDSYGGVSYLHSPRQVKPLPQIGNLCGRHRRMTLLMLLFQSTYKTGIGQKTVGICQHYQRYCREQQSGGS